jgi:hypothetical protein
LPRFRDGLAPGVAIREQERIWILRHQEQLRALHYLRSPSTGTITPEYRAAIGRFQRAEGVSNRILDGSTIPAVRTTLRAGSRPSCESTRSTRAR